MKNMPKKTFLSIFKDAQEKERRKKKPKTEMQKFFEEVEKLTCKKEDSIRKWLQGRNVPPKHVRQRIADYFGVDPDGLFPEASA